MKIISLAALLAIGLSATAHAQTSTQSGSSSGATAIAVTGAGGGANGNGTNGVGWLNTNNSGTIWTLGGTPSIVSNQYDACTKYFSASAILGGLSVPLEIEQCWSMRMADSIAKYPPGSVQYNLLCNDSNVLKNDWDTGTMKCTKNIAILAKQNPNDPRAVPYTGVPVVAVQGAPGPNLQPSAPPRGVNIPAPNAQPTLTQVNAPNGNGVAKPRCSATVRDNCYSG